MKLFSIFIGVFCFFNTLFATYSVIDANGDKLSVNQPLERVACISPSTTELIFAIGGGERLVANSRFCRFPQEATKKIKIGGFIDPDFEKIAQIKPDLFIITRSKNDIFTSVLDRFGILHLSLYEDGLENIIKNIEILGDVFQERENAKELIAKIETKMEEARAKAKTLKAKRAILMFGQMSAGKNSYAGDLLELVGAKNLMSNSTSAWVVPEKEHILVSAPELIILEAKSKEDFENQLNFYKRDTIWSKTPAVRNNHIYAIDSDLISIPCTHIIGAISRLVEILEAVQ